VGDPDGIPVDVADGNDVVIQVQALKAPGDHQDALAGRERVLRRMALLGAADADDQLVHVPRDLVNDLAVAQVERLEAADVEASLFESIYLEIYGSLVFKLCPGTKLYVRRAIC